MSKKFEAIAGKIEKMQELGRKIRRAPDVTIKDRINFERERFARMGTDGNQGGRLFSGQLLGGLRTRIQGLGKNLGNNLQSQETVADERPLTDKEEREDRERRGRYNKGENQHSSVVSTD